MKKKILTILFGNLVRLLTRMRVSGLENIPGTGGAILCVNHLHIIDPVIVYINIQRADMSALVAHKHRQNPFLRWIVDLVGGIWLNREEADAAAIRAAVKYVSGGGILGIAPEGTRSHSGAMLPAKPGVAFLADKVNAPIIPIGLSGTEKVFPALRRLRRARVTMNIGKPFCLPPVERLTRESDLQRNTDELMCRIAALVPPEYRGVYSNHPRVQELLSESSL